MIRKWPESIPPLTYYSLLFKSQVVKRPDYQNEEVVKFAAFRWLLLRFVVFPLLARYFVVFPKANSQLFPSNRLYFWKQQFSVHFGIWFIKLMMILFMNDTCYRLCNFVLLLTDLLWISTESPIYCIWLNINETLELKKKSRILIVTFIAKPPQQINMFKKQTSKVFRCTTTKQCILEYQDHDDQLNQTSVSPSTHPFFWCNQIGIEKVIRERKLCCHF